MTLAAAACHCALFVFRLAIRRSFATTADKFALCVLFDLLSGLAVEGGVGRQTHQMADSQLRRPRAETPQTSEVHLLPHRTRRGREAEAPIGGETRHPRGGCQSEPAPGSALEEGDGAETARLCDELLRWSSALEGAEKKMGGKGAAGMVGRRTGGTSRREEAAARVRPAVAVDEVGGNQLSFFRRYCCHAKLLGECR